MNVRLCFEVINEEEVLCFIDELYAGIREMRLLRLRAVRVFFVGVQRGFAKRRFLTR